ncbi:sulfatase-like hydrolase/transferase [Chitinophaga horti]|uniref:Sulfatase-like hydrolase/transferase n=1 Tax=Chitinophaga horti TaxID=2920382 RepID=A0ABY6J6E9_9BACT|nr:alkaline phosphatase family protein [Chitinophaga horti]UYQ93869.1 sulfatase-like hydrolase/transferase [Chitinophaga horti]
MKDIWLRIPRYIRYVLVQSLILFLFLVLFRVVFYFFFFKSTIHESAAVTKAWYLGLKFDVRLALVIMAPLALIAIIARNRLFANRILRKINYFYLFIIYLGLIFFYAIDLGHYAYLGLRVDPSVTRFLAAGEKMTNARMVWQSYPVIKGVIGIVLLMALLVFLYRRVFITYASQEDRRNGRGALAGWIGALVLVFAAGIYGNFAYFPLRWSQAMFTRDNGITSLALNPVLYFYSNLDTSRDTYDLEKTRQTYKVVADYLGVDQPDSVRLNYQRRQPADSTKPRLNVIVVMMESTGASLTSMFNNPMMATPNLKAVSDSGLLFRNFYIPNMSTARSVFGITTGLADICIDQTASRHPAIVDQRVILDQFTGYEKYYLLGGNTNWANIRAVFTNNVDGIKIYEEGYYKSAKADVWGVSDYDLITEASEIFKAANDRKQPFIAFLQTADNHEPFTTTAGAGDFKKVTEKDIDMQKFKASGFLSVDQFNGTRYLDYNIGHLMKKAKEDGYLDNTIFVFFGDHNIKLNPYHFMEQPEVEMGTWGHHVPLIIYAPRHIAPGEIRETGSLVDVYPTVAALVGMPVTNYTMGVNLLDSSRQNRYAFLVYHKNLQPYHALIGDRYLYEINPKTGETALFDLSADPLKDVKKDNLDTAQKLDKLTRGYYESTRYLMFNNKKG